MAEKCNVERNDTGAVEDLKRILMEPDLVFGGRVKGTFEIFYEGGVPYSCSLEHLNSRMGFHGVTAKRINKYGDKGQNESYQGSFDCHSIFSLIMTLEYIRAYSVGRSAKPTRIDLSFTGIDNKFVKGSD